MKYKTSWKKRKREWRIKEEKKLKRNKLINCFILIPIFLIVVIKMAIAEYNTNKLEEIGSFTLGMIYKEGLAGSRSALYFHYPYEGKWYWNYTYLTLDYEIGDTVVIIYSKTNPDNFRLYDLFTEHFGHKHKNNFPDSLRKYLHKYKQTDLSSD